MSEGLEELAARVEARPSRKVAALAGFGAWMLTALAAVFLKDKLGATDNFVDIALTFGVFLGFITYSEIRLSPADKLIHALRSLVSEKGE